MTNNGYTPTFFDYKRTFLPQLPRSVKNRNMERSRQALRTSAEEYGKFWNGYAQSTALPPTYLTDPTPEAIAAASRWYRNPASGRQPQQTFPHYRNWSGDGDDWQRYVVDYRRNGSHRNHYDLIDNAYVGAEGSWTDRPSGYGGGGGDLQPLSTSRDYPATWWLPGAEDRVARHRYKLTITEGSGTPRRTVTDGVDWTLADISRVDLRVHLADDSVVNVSDIPFYYQ